MASPVCPLRSPCTATSWTWTTMRQSLIRRAIPRRFTRTSPSEHPSSPLWPQTATQVRSRAGEGPLQEGAGVDYNYYYYISSCGHLWKMNYYTSISRWMWKLVLHCLHFVIQGSGHGLSHRSHADQSNACQSKCICPFITRRPHNFPPAK